MKLRVLGCAGGIGGRDPYTTCLALDDDILFDAGTGLATLGIHPLIKIDHIFLTHCHLDHVAGLALLVDTVVGKRTKPVIVHATQPIIDSLKTYLFNWVLWPDFTTIPSAEQPILQWEPMEAGSTFELNDRIISSHPVNHTNGSVAYWMRHKHRDNTGCLFTGDMSSTPGLWESLAHEDKLSKVIVDCSFPNSDAALAALSKHFSPQALIDEIKPLPPSIEFLIYHLKPGQEEQIMQELNSAGGKRRFRAIKRGEMFHF